ncbi:MAG: peptidyl-prolyl cis-trans isomerase [Proteobacteria bacterium]|nr:peptidyl-prolyl cis-trans isomerase [Pseudomonadota bacterium]
MLQHIRERFTGVFAITLLGMLAVSFIFFGIGNFTFLSGGYAAKVADAEISIFQLENAYQNQLLQYSEYGNLPAEARQQLKSNTLERMIRETVVDLYVADEGYRVGDQQIAEIIQSASQFQDNGVFSKELYYAWLEQTVQDPRVFEAQQRQAVRLSQLQRGVGATAFVTPSEYRQYLNLYAEKRQASIAIFDIASLAETIVVRDEDVQAYYDSRPDDFRSPESVDFEFLEINRQTLASEIQIGDDVLQQYYEDNTSRFQQDERRTASHILILSGDNEVAAEEQARALTARINAGEPFADLARQHSKDGGTANQGGSLGTVMQSQMPGALGDTIFSMEQGQVRGPVKTDFGFHIVRLDEIVTGGPLPLDQVRSELLQELRAQGVEGQVQQLERQLSDALFDATDLQSVAAAAGLPVQHVAGFTRSGGEPFGQNQAVIEAAFDSLTLNDHEISDVIEVDVNRSVMIRVTEHHEESRRPLDAVREDIVFALQSDRALNIVDDRSRRLREALEEGRLFADMARELEASYTPNLTVGRTEEDVDTAVLDAIFRAKKPSTGKARLGSVVTTTGDYAVFLVHAVIPGRPESIPLDERDQRKEQLQSVAGAMTYNAFVNELTSKTDIERNESALTEQDLLQ